MNIPADFVKESDRIAQLEREVAFLRSLVEAQNETIRRLLDAALKPGQKPVWPTPLPPVQPIDQIPYDPLHPFGPIITYGTCYGTAALDFYCQ